MSTAPSLPSTVRHSHEGSPSAADHCGAPKRFAGLEAVQNFAGYAAALVLSLAAMAFALRLGRADLRVPLLYHGDDLLSQMIVQSTIEGCWVLHNPRLGAPGSQDFSDFPTPEHLHVAWFKLLGFVFHDSAVVLNLYALLPFPLTALSAYFALRRLRLGRTPALAAAVLYSCAPYHFWQFMMGHLLLTAYYLLPLMALVVVRVYLGRRPFRWTGAAGAVLVCLLTGVAGVYYAFFSCFLLLAAGVRSSIRDRQWRSLTVAVGLVLCVGASLGAALAPTFVYQARHGKNPAVAARSPAEADIFGLSVTEMLMPVQGHRLPLLAKLREAYLAPPRPMTYSAPLGVVASLGFLFLVGRSLWRRRDRAERVEDALAYVNLAAVLLATVGGLGALFSFSVSPMIRCYHRVGVFIAFFALAGLFFALQRLTGRATKNRWATAAYVAGLAALLGLGLLDQTSPWNVPAYAECRREFASDADFGRRIEAALPPGSMVYEMPYMPFPENGPVQGLGDYELLRPYLHTRTLRWSYGAMKGREDDGWQADLASRPLPDAVERLALIGFRGIYLDRAGFADHGAAVEAELTRLLGVAPMVSLSGRQTFFDMTPYAAALARLSDAERQARLEAALHPVRLEWGGAFYGDEQSPAQGHWRFCGAEGRLRLVNPLGEPRNVVLKMECSALGQLSGPCRLVVEADQFRRELSLTNERQPCELELTAPPGPYDLHFSCDGPRVDSTDPRELVFTLWNVQCRVAP